MTEGREIYVIGFDGSEASERAADYAADIAQTTGAKLHFVYVAEGRQPPEGNGDSPEAERDGRILDPAVLRFKGQGYDAEGEIRYGKPSDAIHAAIIETSATHVFIGRKALPSLADRLLGGVAVTLVQTSPVPLTIIP